MKLKKLLSLILASVMLFSVVSCGKTGNTETTAATEAATEAKIPETPNEDYVVVIDKENEGAVSAAERMVWQMKELYDVDLEVIDHNEKAYVKEIVLGKTNRGEKIDTSKMVVNDYEIKSVGEKIFIDGASDDALYGGAVKLINTCTDENGLKIAKDYSFKDNSGYPIKKLTINSHDISKHSIVYPEDASENTMIGVNDLVEYIEKACGVKLETTTKSSDYAIIVEEKVVVVENASNDFDSFTVKSEGNSIRLTGAAERGAMYACYELLEQIGWRFLMENYDYIKPVDSVDLTGLDITESSVFENRRIYAETFINSQDMRNKLRAVEGRVYVGNSCHTFDELDGDFSTQYESQPCLTNPAVYELMLSNVMKLLEANPDAKLISVSQNDNYNFCRCDNCNAAMAKYTKNPKQFLSGGYAGLILEFVNKIAAEVEKEYPDVLIHTFAYLETRSAPQGIKPLDNVLIQLCSIECCFNHGFENEQCSLNAGFLEDLKDWSAITKTLYIWDYNNNFAYRSCPFPNLTYDTLAGNMRLFAENNVLGLFLQGNGNDGNNGEFDRLRWYLLAKLAWDPYMSEEEYYTHMKEFMEGYYGDGWEKIYDVLISYNTDVEPQHIGCLNHNPISTWVHIRTKNTIDGYVDAFNEAKLMTDTLARFNGVESSSIQFLYVQCDVHFDKLHKSEDPADNQLAQDMCMNLQNLMKKHGTRYGGYRITPDYEYFEYPPSLWKANWYEE